MIGLRSCIYDDRKPRLQNKRIKQRTLFGKYSFCNRTIVDCNELPSKHIPLSMNIISETDDGN